MKINVLEPQKVIYSAETREITIDYNGKKLIIRQAEDDNGGENIVLIDDKWVKSYELKDEDLKQIVETVCDNIRDGSFDAKGEVDLSEYE
jgi:hypothetical protein